MGRPLDPELLEVLPDPDLLDIARLLSTRPLSAAAELAPLDQSFKWALRRRLLDSARTPAEPAAPWWRRLAAPPTLAWAGAAVGALLIAAVVVLNAVTPPFGGSAVTVSSPIADAQTVPLQQPIPVQFSQPMEHSSTEAAVQIQPATRVTFEWQGNTLLVQPQNRQLAPNTQYQVTVGSGAKAVSGQAVAEPQTITFVTQPAPTPRPSPTPAPSPKGLVNGERQLAALGDGRVLYAWAPDETSLYLRGKDGQLAVVPAGGGQAKQLLPDGVDQVAVSPDGTRVALVRAGKLQVLTVKDGRTAEVAGNALAVGWKSGTLLWIGPGGDVLSQSGTATTKIASIPPDAAVISFAPGGERLVYQQARSLFLFDLAGGKSTPIGGTFSGWSPDGKRLATSSKDGITIADSNGRPLGTITALPGSGPVTGFSWGPDQILVSTATVLYAVGPDGSSPRKLADGDFQLPQLSPSGGSFAFVRAGNLWAGDLAEPVPPGAVPDAAYRLVNSFLGARVAARGDDAQAFLDTSGKEAYATGSLNLLITGDPHLSRFFVVAAQAVGTPASYRFTLRLVLVHEKTEVSQFDEALTVQRDANGKLYVHQAAAGARRPVGKGPEVIAAGFSGGRLRLAFDSDLDAVSAAASVEIHDLAGHAVAASAEYADRAVTLSATGLKPGTTYRISVLPALKDVAGRPPVSEYDLDLVAPAEPAAPSPSPLPSPSASA